jgi:membrane protease subunit HflK
MLCFVKEKIFSISKMESPWGGKHDDNHSNKNDFDDFFNNSRKKITSMFGNKGGNSNIVALAVSIILALWLATGFYKVDEGEQAVVLRFGKFVSTAMPGLNYHIPDPIERIIKQKVERVENEEIGFRSAKNPEAVYAQKSASRNISEESLMLTGDENILDVNFVVQWKISNIKDFVFNVQRPKETVRSAAESVMREVIGNTPIAAAQTQSISIVERTAMTLLQSTLDLYKAGIVIENIKLLKIDPPAEVVDSFRDVQTARADKEREINQAQAYQNDVIPRARGEAARITQDAEAYKHEVVALASGEVSRFNAVYHEYKNAKQITKKRIYIETMEEVLKDLNKVIVDPSVSKGVVPYLTLPSTLKNENKN